MINNYDLIEMQKIEFEMVKEMDKVCREFGLEYYLAYGTVLGAVRHKGFIPWDSDIDIMVEIDKYSEFCDLLESNISEKYIINSIKTDATYEELFARIGLKDQLHHKIHIDIFPIAGAPNNSFMRKVFSKIAYINYRCFFIKKVNVNINYVTRPRKKRLALLSKAILALLPSVFFVWVFKILSNAYPIKETNTLCNICGSYGMKEFIPKAYLEGSTYMDFEGYSLPVPSEWDKYLTHMYGDYMTPKKENYV